jgi:hypothetical protein
MVFQRSPDGKRRYINNLYIPNTAAEDWDLETVVQDYVTQWENSDLATVLHTAWELLYVMGRVRGDRPDAGITHTVAADVVGTVTGGQTPAWLVYTLLQEPDNVNRLVLTLGTSMFRKGRIAMPSPPASFLNGDNVSSTAVSLYAALFPYWLGLDANANPTLNPGFSLAMTRVNLGVVNAKANVSSIIGGELGTQLTARD